MRRSGFRNKRNYRKNTKNNSNKINIRNSVVKIICTVVVVFLILFFVIMVRRVFKDSLRKEFFEDSIISFGEKNQKKVFFIDKIVLFSSCDVKNKTNSVTNFTIENLYAYTDIAVFIDTDENNRDEENTIKNLEIKNIKFSKKTSIGDPGLYFKSINNFAKGELKESNKVENDFVFDVTSEDNVELNRPVIYNNCANPITLSYINQNIRTDYTMLDIQNPIVYNGKLLSKCNVSLEMINSSISFDIELENNKKQKFRTNVYLDNLYEDDDGNNIVNEGSLIKKIDSKIEFYRYE